MPYLKRKPLINKSDLYKQKFKDKGVTSFKQLSVPSFVYPTEEEIQTLEIFTDTWKQGDSFEKISYKYYNDVEYWWIIPFFNNKPTEQHFNIGDKILIPLPLYKILNLLGL